MGRRGHKKSRLGCAECKKRHVKCDETRPRCVNCKTAGIKCSYHNEIPDRDAPYVSPQTASVSPAAWSEPNFNDPPFSSASTTSTHRLDVNFDHLELLYSFQTETYKSLIDNQEIAHMYKQNAIQQGFKHPFLMYEILAIASYHLSFLQPGRATFLRKQSATLQSMAVNGFTEIMADINDSNYIAVFIFSTLMGQHAFVEAFYSFRETSDFNNLMDKFTNSMKSLKGITVVMDGFWEKLASSELRDLLEAGRVLDMAGDQGEECVPLRDLIDEADLSDASKKACEHAVSDLQRNFEAEKLIETSAASVSPLFAWLVRAGDTYIAMLQQRRPEALIILAYYGVILHSKRKYWAIQDVGRYLIHAIASYLGSHWSRWLEWPLTAIQDKHGHSTPSTAAFQSPASFP